MSTSERQPTEDRARMSPVIRAEEPNDTSASRASPSPMPPPTSAASPTNSVSRQHLSPIMTNAHPPRPPSSASVHSNTSGAVSARSTTTSRRGGRTRCRSPPAMINRPGSTNAGEYPDSYSVGGPPPPMEDRRAEGVPPSPANPSAAAAAAAAAAKSLSNTSRGRNPPPSSWGHTEPSPESGRDYGRRHRGESSRYQQHASSSQPQPPPPPPPHHRSGYGGSSYAPQGGGSQRNWPEEEEGPPPSSRSGRAYGSQSIHRRSGGEEHYGYREGYSQSSYSARHPGPGGSSERYPPYDDTMEYDRRYPEHSSRRAPYDERMTSRRGPPPPSDRNLSPRAPSYGGPPGDHLHHSGPRVSQRRDERDMRGDPYYKNSSAMAHMADGTDPEASRADAGPGPTVKRTTRVIGTATPIHVPRAPEPGAPSSRNSREGTPASVFRRPGSSGGPPPPRNGSQEEETVPPKVLLALGTPPDSYEEKQSGSKPSSRRAPAGDAGPPLSPEAPPQIQHSHQRGSSDPNLFFEPQRSPKGQPGPPEATNSIEMAPSFSLFNQSFDSFGDSAQYFNVGGPLDAALQSTSFGVGLGASMDLDKREVSLNQSMSMSGGNNTQQLLGGSGSAGALTFGMSPNNSFGGAPNASTRSTMVLGGQDGRSASPTQVLGMYRSYSETGSPKPNRRPLDDSHIRMSGGSFGTPSIGNAYTRSFGGEGPPPPGQYRNNSMSHQEGPADGPADGPPRFYNLLKKYRGAFQECTFLLPGLKQALLDNPLPDTKQEAEKEKSKRGRSGNAVPDHNSSMNKDDPSPQDSNVAMRRIASAVCAFGGTIMGDRASLAQQKASAASAQSIFREKDGDAATVTPSITPRGSYVSRQKIKYDEQLPSRYYENDNRLSWEFEEHPPVDDSKEEEEDAEQQAKEENEKNDKSKNGEDANEKKDGADDDDASKTNQDGDKKDSAGADQPKMRYRCKLCGQPKQNHTCPYQQSLARSIGANVYPAVNAFTSAEPGLLAPALSEMNNFVISDTDSVSSVETSSPSRPTPDRMRHINPALPLSSAQVTPESMRGTTRGVNSPISAMSSSISTPQRRTPGSSRRKGGAHGMGRNLMGGTPGSSSRKKRTNSQMGGSEDQGELLFVEPMELKPEQFRMVTASKITSQPDAFTYPALPLPYAQRKRLSDNLFALSKEVPRLTDECAACLREAREKDLWDLAVAELMTQVVVVVHCQDGDARFEGLRRYLLTLGIAC